MIFFPLWTNLQSPGPSIEAIPSQDQTLSVDIFVKFSGGGPFDFAINACLGKLAFNDTRDYGHETMKELTDRASGRIQEEATPAGIHIWFKLLPVDSASLVPLCENLIYYPVMEEVEVARAKQELIAEAWNPLRRVLWPYDLPYSDIHIRDLNVGLARNSAPQNVYVTLACPGSYAYLAQSLKETISKHTNANPPYWKADPLKFRVHKAEGQSRPIVWQAPPITPNSKNFAANYLSMMILGGGKGALIWKIWRTDLRLSYFQEADYSAVPAGLAPTLFMFCPDVGADKAPQISENAIQALMDAAAQLTPTEVARAKAFAESVLLRGYGMDPLHVTSETGNTPLFMSNLWRSMGGNDPDWSTLNQQIQALTFDQVKAYLGQWLDTFHPFGRESGSGLSGL